MKLLTYLIITFAVAFVLQHWIISMVVTTHPRFVHHNRSKLYISLFAASVMGILEVIIYDSYNNTVSLFYYIGLGLAIYGFAHAYKTQMGVTEKDYLNQMIEASSRDMLLSQNLINHTQNINVRTVATNIINKRKRDMDMMTQMMAQMDKGPVTNKELFDYQKLL